MTVPTGRPELNLLLGSGCVGLLGALVGVTVVDVVGRYLFNAPLSGAFELTQILLAALVFAALPLTTRAGEHVEVDLLFGSVRPRLQTLMRWVAAGVTATMLWVIAWRLAVHGYRLAADGAVTSALGLPLAPVSWFGAVMAGLSGALALVRLITSPSPPSLGD